MKVIVCLDNKNGMLFNNRRQSMDSALRAHMLKMTENGDLWMNTYSAGQFSGQEGLRIDDDFLDRADSEDWCFVEDLDIAPYIHRIRTVVIYRWNRIYPADMFFPENLFENSWKKISSCDFPGNSHDNITQEVFCL